MTTPTVGDVVVLTELDSEPPLLVTAVDEANNDVTGVLLADLAKATIQRLEASADDSQRRQDLTTAIQRTEDLMTFCVPVAELRHRDGPDRQGRGPLTGGDQ